MIAVPTVAAGEPIPLPRPRPASMLSGLPPAAAIKEAAPAASAAPVVPAATCLARLTKDVAIASPLPPIESEGCEVPDVVRMEAIVLKDKSLIAVTPPA